LKANDSAWPIIVHASRHASRISTPPLRGSNRGSTPPGDAIQSNWLALAGRFGSADAQAGVDITNQQRVSRGLEPHAIREAPISCACAVRKKSCSDQPETIGRHLRCPACQRPLRVERQLIRRFPAIWKCTRRLSQYCRSLSATRPRSSHFWPRPGTEHVSPAAITLRQTLTPCIYDFFDCVTIKWYSSSCRIFCVRFIDRIA